MPRWCGRLWGACGEPDEQATDTLPSMASPPSQSPPRGVQPHLAIGGAWYPYPDHRWFAGTAWHYTSVQGFYGIVSNHELWASSATMLNDVGEMSFGVSRVRDVFGAWSPRTGADGFALGVVRDAIAALDSMMAAAPPFVLSASTSPGLLNQWANYGESTGCAIGLETMSLLAQEGATGTQGAKRALPLWLEVVYLPQDQEAYIRRILDDLVAPDNLIARLNDTTAHGGPETVATQNLLMLAAALKHPGFEAEKEVRLVAFRDEEATVHFRATPRGIVPYVKFFATTADTEAGVQYSTSPHHKIRLPITGARVGPPQGDSETRRTSSMREFLVAQGYEVAVGGAGIPYLP